MDMIKRMEATQRTVDAFKGRTFDDRKADCIRLIGCHARHMGRRIKIPAYRDASSAAKALRAAGFKTLGEAMDKHFTRIDRTKVLMSDIIEMPGSNGFSSLAVAVGNGRVLGFHEDVPHCDILQPLMISGAWRIV